MHDIVPENEHGISFLCFFVLTCHNFGWKSIMKLCYITQRPYVNLMYPKSLTTVYNVSCNCIDIQPMHQTYRKSILVVEITFSSMSVILFDSRCLQRKREN